MQAGVPCATAGLERGNGVIRSGVICGHGTNGLAVEDSLC